MGLSSDMLLLHRPSSIRNRRNNIRSRLARLKHIRKRRAMLATGCGVTKICLPRSKNAHSKMTRRSAVCHRHDSRFCGIDCSGSPTCRRNSS